MFYENGKRVDENAHKIILCKEQCQHEEISEPVAKNPVFQQLQCTPRESKKKSHLQVMQSWVQAQIKTSTKCKK